MIAGMKVKGLADPNKATGDYQVKMSVSFGPGFHRGPLTRRQFAARLRELAKERPTHFIGMMFAHYADHIDAAAEAFPNSRYSLDAPASLENLATSYDGCGSCTECSISHPGGDCANCTHDDVTSCEPCG